MKPQKEAEAEVRSWGFSHVFTWSDGPNSYYPPHSHAGLTTHLILRGQLTIAYPDDKEANNGDGDSEQQQQQQKKKTTYSVGDRIDVDAGRVHEVWTGPEGCTYVIGE
ncbi:hypothetical protein N656DRAFT_773585 [Canariomyces notabilis]|uniref:Uncharacterized protein n=1 Tax=Canariomyces notabilis TaxID=2074819 RepID=A0AAN6TMW4_9PEZI|nr:hypothetical protein N656DRAFT_773585 [Canariomyces arenarius]